MATNRPAYAVQALRTFLSYTEESDRLLEISIRGITVLTRMPKLAKELAGWTSKTDEEDKAAIEEAERVAEFANKEIESGFPLLHAHTLVGLWGALEAAVSDTLLNILLNEPGLLKYDCFAKVRITLAEFEMLDREDRMRFLLEEISRAQGFSHKQGVDKFEALLDNFQLSGPVDDQTKKTLWEINHLRNAIVHRASLADRRLLKACPWLGLKVAEKIVITPRALNKYHGALCGYATTLIHRLARRFDANPPQPHHESASPAPPHA